jgi:hypothetical protein
MNRLIDKMNEYVTVNGMSGKADLCKATNRGMRSVERWLAGQVVPSTQLRYIVAVTIGCTHKEALSMAEEPAEATKAS